MATILSDEEKEKQVIDLYFNQGKNTHEIAKLLRMSLSSIGPIMKRVRQKRAVSYNVGDGNGNGASGNGDARARPNDNYNQNNNSDGKQWEVYTYNDPIAAFAEFKPNFYDLILVDINMPDLNGFELSQRILQQDVNIRVCYMPAAEINERALREVYPKISIGCFIQKPVAIDYL